jgi:hypothetical protein
VEEDPVSARRWLSDDEFRAIELEENVERLELTPYEASKLRWRRSARQRPTSRKRRGRRRRFRGFPEKVERGALADDETDRRWLAEIRQAEADAKREAEFREEHSEKTRGRPK